MHGGVVYCENHTVIMIKGNSNIMFTNNNACLSCGGDFTNNDYGLGGALYFLSFSVIVVDENSMATFSNNSAKEGGAIIC